MKRELYNLGIGMYGGYATHLKIWVKEIHDKNHADYIEYRADLHLALDFLIPLLILNDSFFLEARSMRVSFILPDLTRGFL